MKIKRFLMIIFLILIFQNQLTCKEYDNSQNKQPLTKKQEAIIPIAAFTAEGNIDNLKKALNKGLDSGLTINEIKEVLVQLYAYSGFPKSLNALNTFMQLLETRKKAGINDVMGKESTPLPKDFNKDEYGAKIRAMLAGRKSDITGAKWQKFSPIIDTFLKEHLFADIFARDVITHADRELVTIAALANMNGTNGQLFFHFKAALNTGLTKEQLNFFITVMKNKVGLTKGENAEKVLKAVLTKKK